MTAFKKAIELKPNCQPYFFLSLRFKAHEYEDVLKYLNKGCGSDRSNALIHLLIFGYTHYAVLAFLRQ